jgi:hypothetical protein
MPCQRGGKGARRVPSLPIRDQGPATSHHPTHEVSTQVRFRHQTALSNGQNSWLARLKFLRFAERMGDDQAVTGVRQYLSESLEQSSIPAGEKDHGLSLGRGEEPVKGWERYGLNLNDLIS